MKYFAIIMAALVVFSGLILSTCEKRNTDVYAVVNGIDIRGKDFLTPENRISEEKKQEALLEFIEKKVIELEAQKLNTTKDDLFSFFDRLKNRDIPTNKIEKIFKEEFKDHTLGPKSKQEMLSLIQQKQYELARAKYIYELKARATILLVDDEGVFHTYKPSLN